MFTFATNVEELLRNFRFEGATFRYSSFVPRLYNYVKSLGFEPHRILPSRAFCSDESQGYPIILIAKHFGSFPFNHGRGGAVVATDRHGPYAEHGEDLVIIQASHVGYDPDSGAFGTYSRIHTRDVAHTACCGKLAGVVAWYLEQYRFAQSDVLLERCKGALCLRIDNGLLLGNRQEGLFLNLPRLIRRDPEGNFSPLYTHSTSKSFVASEYLQKQLADLEEDLGEGQSIPIGDRLQPDMFVFRRSLDEEVESRDHQQASLMYAMPWVVTSPWPLLTAAQINTQVEFDRALRSAAHSPAYRGKNLFHISGLNIDISPQPGDPFPTTKFVPWAAFYRDREGRQRIFEQTELVALLRGQSRDNPDQVDLDNAIQNMAEAESVEVVTPDIESGE